MSLAQATMFETGTNLWCEFDTWPLKKGKDIVLYMVADIKLLDQKEPRSGSSDYFSDSSKASHTQIKWVVAGVVHTWQKILASKKVHSNGESIRVKY